MFHRLAIALLLLSGVIHTPIFIFGEKNWSDPTSMRKAILFGLSTGVTLWSCHRVMDVLKRRAGDNWLRWTLSISLTLEVFLITLQAWRGQASHFNHQGHLNIGIEQAMLALILIASVVIAWLTYRSCFDRPMIDARTNQPIASEREIALRWGMVFLLASCVLGFVITGIGKALQSNGLDPEIYGARGVLKFPHGAALHAIQTLEIVALVLIRLRSRSVDGIWCIRLLIIGHGFWLLYALIQTFSGRGRWEL